MATHTDYKIEGPDTAGDVVTVRAVFFEGVYRAPDPHVGPATVSTAPRYHRDREIGERVYTFAVADYSDDSLRAFLDDVLDGVNPLTNIPEQARTSAPTLSPTTTEVRR